MALDEAGLQAEIGITLNKLTKQLAQAEARMNKTAKKIEDGFKRPTRAVERGFEQADRSASNFARGGLRNVSLQLSQVAQQGAATGDFMKALAIQLPDLALGFGTVGIAIGALGGLLLPVAVDMLGFADNSKEAEEKAKAFAKALGELETAMRSANEAVALASVSGLEDLEQLYGDVTSKVRDLAKALAEIEVLGVQKKVSDILEEVIDADFGKNISQNISGIAAAVVETTAEEIEAMRREITLLEQEIANSAIPNPSQVSLLAEMRQELALATGEIEKAGELGDSFSVDPADVDRMRELTRLIPEAVAEQNFQGAADMISELRVLMRDFGAETRDGLGKELTNVEDILRRAALLLQKAEAAAVGVSNASSDMASEIGGAADEAERLADNLFAAMSAEFKARADAPQGGRGGDPRDLEKDPYWRDRFFPSPERSRTKTKSRRSGGGRSTQTFDPLESGERQISQLQLQLQTVGRTSAAVAELTAKYQLLEAAKRRGVDLDRVSAETGRTVRQEIEAQAATIGDLTAKYQAAAANAQFFNDMSLQLSDGLVDAIVEGENLAGVMADLAKQIAKAALQAALFGQGPMAGLFGASPGVGLLSGLFGGFRAGGGGVKAGTPYMVNERTPNSEIFVPSQNGAILNVAQAQQALRGAQAPQVNVAPAGVKVIVLDDPNKIGEYLASPSGERAVVATMQRNRDAI